MLSDLPLVSYHQDPIEDQFIKSMMSAICAHRQDKMPTPEVVMYLYFEAQVYLDFLNCMKLVGSGYTEIKRLNATLKNTMLICVQLTRREGRL